MKFDDVKIIHVEPSGLCQAYCTRCARTTNHNSRIRNFHPYIKKEEYFKHILPFLNNTHTVVFCGNYGDSMTNPDICDIAIATAKTVKFASIHTNGGVGSANDYYEMAKSGIHIVFAVEGSSQTINEKYRRGVNFEKLIDNIEAASAGSRGLNNPNAVSFQVLAWAHSIDDIDNIIALAKKYNASLRLAEPTGITSNNTLPTYNKSGEFQEIISVYDGYRSYPSRTFFSDSSLVLSNDYIDKLLPELKAVVNWNSAVIANSSRHETLGEITAFKKPNNVVWDRAQYKNSEKFTTYDSHKSISCRSIDLGEIFVSHDMTLMPCCMIGTRITGHTTQTHTTSWNPGLIELYEDNGGQNMFDIRLRTIPEILESENFYNIGYRHISGTTVYKHCDMICGAGNACSLK